MKVTENNINLYFESLKNLQRLLSYTDNISTSKFCEKNNIDKSTFVVLSKNGVLHKTGNMRSARYKWNTIDPTKAMAKKVIEKIIEYKRQINRAYIERIDKEKREANKTTTQNIKGLEINFEPNPSEKIVKDLQKMGEAVKNYKPIKIVYVTRLFWGLIKIKTTSIKQIY